MLEAVEAPSIARGRCYAIYSVAPDTSEEHTVNPLYSGYT
jgi:hypothetical protein